MIAEFLLWLWPESVLFVLTIRKADPWDENASAPVETNLGCPGLLLFFCGNLMTKLV